jgi:LacI family transcriptional regulator
MKVGLQDIASELSLSVSTVSRSLRSHPAISSETRAKVYEAASKLGYRGPKGRTVRRGKEPVDVMNITVLIQTDYRSADVEDTVPGHMLHGMSEAAFELGVTMNVHYVSFKHRALIDRPEYQPPAMRNGQADGLILIQHYPREVVLGLSKHFPCVAVCNSCLGGLLDYVGFNNNYGIQKIVDHLHGLGHRKIGFIRSFEGTSWLEERFAGYIQGLSRLGLEYSTKNVLSVEVDTSIPGRIPDLKRADRELLFEKTRRGITAWVCVSDYIG